MVVTESEAREMKTAMEDFQTRDNQLTQAQARADLSTATDWFNTLGIRIQAATTRTQALDNFYQIESLLKTETNRFRITILRQKLDEANEKYKQVKKVNPVS